MPRQFFLRASLLLLAPLWFAACSSPGDRAAGYVKRAQEMLAAGDLQNAKLEAQNAAQIEPKNAEARWILAQIADQNGDLGQMLGNLEIVIAEDQENVPARIKLATVLVFGQDYPGAQLLLDQVQKLAPDDPTVRLLSARLFFTKNDIPAAIRELDFVLEKEPKNAEAALLRGVAFADADLDRALRELAASAEVVDPKDARSLLDARVQLMQRAGRNADVEAELKNLQKAYPDGGYSANLADFYVSQNRPDDAEEALRAAIAEDPDNVKLKVGLAEFQSRARNRPEVAEETLKKFIAEEPDNLELPVLLGTFYEAKERPADAVAQYEAVVAKGAKTESGLAARNRLMAIALAAGDRAKANAELEKILADAPDNPAALATRGELSLAEGRPDAAVADFRMALRKSPDDKQLLQLLARAHRQMGEPSLAQDAYRRLLQVDPANNAAAVEFAQLLAARGQQSEAEDIFRQVVQRDAANLEARNGVVELLLSRNALDDGEREARAMAALDDPLGVGSLQLGRVLLAKNEFVPAKAAFEKTLGRSPNSQRALEGLIAAMSGAGEGGRIVGVLRDYVKANPDQTIARVLLGGNLAQAGQVEEARKILQGVLAVDANSPGPYLALAATYRDDPAERIRILEQGVKAAPAAMELGMTLATEYQLAGRHDDAIKHLDGMLAANPERPRVANNLAAVLLDHRTDKASHQRALELVQKYSDTRDPSIQDTLGWAYYRLGEFDRAVSFLELAAASGVRVPIVRYHLGMAYLATQNTEGAGQEFAKALELSRGAPVPGVKESREELAKLGKPVPG